MPRRRARKWDAHTLSTDLWGQVVINMFDQPRKVLMLLCSIKGFRLSDEWWEKFWFRHRLYNEARNFRAHYYLNYDLKRACQYKTIFRLVYGMFCQQCGCRYHHHVFGAYRLRICTECLRDNHVSNVVLARDYGIGLEEIAQRVKLFVRYIALQYYSKDKMIKAYTRDPRDFEVRKTSKLAFFWMPDLRRFFDMDERRRRHLADIAACNVIKAAVQRNFALSIRRRYLVETLHTNELSRAMDPTTKHRKTYGTNTFLGCVFKPKRSPYPPEPIFNVFLALCRPEPLPVLGDREYTIRTMAHKLDLDREGVERKILELAPTGSLAEILNEIFTI
jgi:hypothetical protein